MWALNKPTLADAKADIPNVIAHAQKLKSADTQMIEDLYTQYDSKGYCTTTELAAIPAEKADSLFIQYPKTYGTDTLSYIKNALKGGVTVCPYCGIGGFDELELDHFMNKSAYHALAVCRLNLVPSCGCCNGLKDAEPYTEFIHPYYPGIAAGVIFLKCDVVITAGSITTAFYADHSVLGAQLGSRVDSHLSKLDLANRYRKACNDYLTNLFVDTKCKTDNGVRRVVNRELSKQERDLKPNDWHCAFLRGLLENPSFDYRFITTFILGRHSVNGGAGL